MNRIRLFQGDITQMHVDAIVNAANKSLLGGGGVDGTIHRAAGPKLLKECKKLNGCETGQAKITRAYQLPARYVIHTVGPIWHGGMTSEKEQLAAAYYNSLKLAKKRQLKTIAFPNISTGVYAFPKKDAAKIALKTVHDFLQNDNWFEEITFCVYDDENFNIYNELLNS